MSDTVVAWRANPSRHFARILNGMREVARELFEAAVTATPGRAY